MLQMSSSDWPSKLGKPKTMSLARSFRKPNTLGSTAMSRAILQASLKKPSENIKEVLKKKSIKFNLGYITDSEDDFRKKMLWQLQDCRFRRANSSAVWKVFVCSDVKLPTSVAVPGTVSQYKLVVLFLESFGSIETKFPGELKFMVLNNEVSLHHKSKGPVYQVLKTGYNLTVPPNKRFYIQNKDVCSSHLLLLLPPSFDRSKLPKFLI